MELISLTCNNCGAPLEIPESMEFVTCDHCDSKLKVLKKDNALYTEVLEEINERLDEISGDVEIIKLEKALAKLELNWADEERQYNKHNRRRRMSPKKSISLGMLAIVAGIGLTIVILNMAASQLMLLIIIPVSLAIYGVFLIFRAFRPEQVNEEYESALRKYIKRKLTLEKKITKLRSDDHDS